MEPQQQIAAGPQGRALVIDDNDDFCRLLSRLIGELGYEVTTTSKFKAVDFAKIAESDIIFLDMFMPDTDGIQILDILSRSEVKSSIVLMSGTHRDVLTTADAIARRSGLRVIGTLTKPFRSRDIRRILESDRGKLQSNANEPVASEINIEDVLAGIERKEFDVYFQPIIDLVSYQAVCYEALARWRSEKFSLVMPDRFIAVAARHGILPRLSRQIIHKTLAYAAKLRDRDLIAKVSVNLGAEDLMDIQLPEQLADIVASYHLPAGSLTVELTESSASRNEIAMFGILARMRLKGIDLAIDDYGTAYSGLERLSNIPFTSLKIDRRFISDLMTNRSARAIVESSIALARRLKMRSVAEGIETEDQLSILKKMGCDFGQGYLFARPMEFEHLVAWVSDPTRQTPFDLKRSES